MSSRGDSRDESGRDFGRDLRVADFVRDELALIMQREMRDPRVGLVSINEVKVSRDLSFADIYVSHLAGDEGEESKRELIDVLSGAAGYFRSELAKRHRMRTTPRLRFHYDELAQSAPRMESLIDRAKAADAKAASRRGDDPQPASPGAEEREHG